MYLSNVYVRSCAVRDVEEDEKRWKETPASGTRLLGWTTLSCCNQQSKIPKNKSSKLIYSPGHLKIAIIGAAATEEIH